MRLHSLRWKWMWPVLTECMPEKLVLSVNTTVTLPDGSTQTVQVPQVYARVKPGDVNSAVR